jgi:quercetin dioxygenase-like cupin family protein
VAAILQISRALSLDAGGFFTTEEKDASERIKVESYEKRTRSYAYRSLSPGARTKHLRAFLVSIDPRQDHDMVEYRHEGEEFIYVLKGKLEVTVGSHVNNLALGESLHFNSGIRHMLRNPGAKKAELLVVLYTP